MNYSFDDYYKTFHVFFWQNSTKLTPEEDGILLKIIRKAFGYNQSFLSQALNISASFVSMMENGRKPISFQTKTRLMDIILIDNSIKPTDNVYEMSDVVSKIVANKLTEIRIYDEEIKPIIEKARQEDISISATTEKEKTDHYVSSDLKVRRSYFNNFSFDSKKVANAIFKAIDVEPSKDEMAEELLILSLRSSLANTEHKEELTEILHKSLMDITSFVNDIDIIRRTDLESTLDRISRSIRKMLRDSYKEIRKDIYVLGYVGAGEPYDYIELRDMIVLPNKIGVDYGLIVRGDSMSPVYSDGDTVFVKEQNTLENGEYGIFDLNGKKIFKRFYKETDRIILRSLNKNYKDIIIKEDEYESFKILGKVYMSH